MSSAGQADAVGGVFRVVAATYLAAHALTQQTIPALDLPYGVHALRLDFETTEPTDDIKVTFSDSRRAFISCKRKVGNDAALRSTIAGWVAQEKSARNGDLLVIAAETLSGVMNDLDQALRRLRNNQPITRQAEIDAVDAVRSRLPQAKANEILHRVRILHVPSSTGASSQTRSLLVALTAFVVEDGQGEAAVDALSTAFSHQAGRADGSSLDDWVSTLTNAGLVVIADASGPAGMRAAARTAAVNAYQTALTSTQGRVDLTLLADDLPPLTADLIDSLQVTTDESKGGTHSLVTYVRRWRRALLVGLPGAGKSVALRELAAHCVLHPFAPTPVQVHLGRLLQSDPSRLTVEVLVQAAASEAVPGQHQAPLTEHLLRAIANGSAVLLCDGLDECGSRANWMVHQLADILAELPKDVGFVLATRASAVSSAASLSLPRLNLQTPRNLDSTVRAVLSACAKARATEDTRPEWLRSRRAWLQEAEKHHKDLFAVPLLAILVTLMCADTTGADLPRSRARVLHAAVEQSVRRWELSREKPGAPSAWSTDLTPAQLFDGYVVLGRLLEAGATPTKSEAVIALRARLSDPSQWGLAPANATEIALEILRFWDEHVAVFVIDNNERLTSRSKVFTEIAAAMWTSSTSTDDFTTWLRDRVDYTDSDEVVALAAGLDSRVAVVLLNLSAEQSSATILLCGLVLRDGVALSEEGMSRLLAALNDHAVRAVAAGSPPSRAPRDPPAWRKALDWRPTASVPPSWQFIELACELPLTIGLRGQRDDLVIAHKLPPTYASIATAIRGLTDARIDRRALTPAARLAITDVMDLPMPAESRTIHRSRRQLEVVGGAPPLPGVAEVALRAVRHLDDLPQETASWAFEISMRTRGGIGEQIRAALQSAHVDTSEWWRRRTQLGSLATVASDHADGEQQLLADLATLSPNGDGHATLDLWSLGAISDLLAAAGYFEVGVADFQDAIRHDPAQLRRSWFVALAKAFEIDARVVTRQAKTLHSALPEPRKSSSDLDVATTPPPALLDPTPAGLATLSDDDHQTLLNCLRATSDWIAFSAARLLASVTEPTWDAELLFNMDLSKWRRYRAALVYVIAILTAGDQRSTLLRAAATSSTTDYLSAAGWAIRLDPDLDPHRDVYDLLRHHPDLALRPKETLNDHPACSHWTCGLCRSQNDIDADDCTSCDQGTRPDLD